MFTEPKPLAIITLILIGKVFVFVEEGAILDRIGNPPGLIDVSLEKVLDREWVIDWLKLIGEALVKLRKNTSVLFDDYTQFPFFFVFSATAAVGDVEH
jgi:hypothetical protein